MHHCRPHMMAPIVHPTHCCEHHTFSKTIVPHIHPQHTTNVNHQHFQHVHYFPHTFSNVDSATHQHFQAGKPCCDY
ncbi:MULTISPECIES: spore coat protein CotD [Bacillus]|uniref:Spore coat protein CotD n=2 Tax=Bacillus subtilis TaxID=1423 RepID=A0AAQ3ES25_BACIU|nr:MULTISPECIES: spore coat protein CotD [Bacillus]ASU98511.1 spore coat protein [Bacillus subtilis]ASZ61780.1 spore coat protein [Bacillus subtilis]MBE0187728.1 spore coat protein CotD [Bacillus subtilis]MBO3764291.1 spore coat protein CotD [Bacillus subtilis]MCT6513081.1 spore coat protein CotD [Bacillus subtilis]